MRGGHKKMSERPRGCEEGILRDGHGELQGEIHREIRESVRTCHRDQTQAHGGEEVSFGDWLFSLFDGLGPEWVLLCICLLFLLDAILIPTLPEVFFIMGFDRQPTVLFGGELLLAAIIGELIGIFSLYYVVKHIRVPKRISKIADKYVNFLIVSDEKALLMNRIAPMIPFAGAFIALIESWDPKKCVFYIVTGCVLK